MKNRRNLYIYFLTLSFVLHILVFSFKVDLSYHYKKYSEEKKTALNIRSIQFIKKKGDIESLELQGKDKKSETTNNNPKRELKLSDLANLGFNPKRPTAKALLKNSEKKNENISAREIKKFITKSPGSISSGEMLKQLGNNDISVSFGVPEGIEEDELNKSELVFFSFRQRLAEAYVSSFFNKLNDFNVQNPHLQFPMTSEEQVMTGKVTYDARGNIMRIRMIRWTETQRLQDFFEDVLRNLGNLSNPPDQMVQNGQFDVFYTLNVKK